MWKIVFTKIADKNLSKIEAKIADRIVKFLKTRVASLDDPRKVAKPMLGEFKDHWRYRVGDYRIICKISGETITIVVVKIGHRREIYR